ncbi:hypothetical protein, partial [Mesorhizobium sp. B2-7-1]|uniref:hypothetical protein n=1 Tax=Mesorhizobium sp. B2-7-1 TaxID=2589909 RepID=UPI0032B290CC
MAALLQSVKGRWAIWEAAVGDTLLECMAKITFFGMETSERTTGCRIEEPDSQSTGAGSVGLDDVPGAGDAFAGHVASLLVLDEGV